MHLKNNKSNSNGKRVEEQLQDHVADGKLFEHKAANISHNSQHKNCKVELIGSISISQLKESYVNIMTLHKDQLLASKSGSNNLYLYSTDGQHLSTVTAPGKLCDVAWTPHHNIVCTVNDSNDVILLSHKGDVISKTSLANPQKFDVTADGFIHLADREDGIFESTDGGITWLRLFQPPEDWQCYQVIKVLSDHGSDKYWTLECNDEQKCIRLYTRMRQSSGQIIVSHREINLTSVDGSYINLANSKLAYDYGTDTVYLSDLLKSTVHAFSSTGKYLCQILSPRDINYPCKLTVDEKYHKLYIGQRCGAVQVFKCDKLLTN